MEIVLPHFNQKLNRLVRTLAGNFVMVEGWSKGQRKLCSLPGYMPIFVFFFVSTLSLMIIAFVNSRIKTKTYLVRMGRLRPPVSLSFDSIESSWASLLLPIGELGLIDEARLLFRRPSIIVVKKKKKTLLFCYIYFGKESHG